MLRLKEKELLSILKSAPLAEPVKLPRLNGSWKANDLWALADSENSYELVRGELFVMSPASPVQGRYASRLNVALGGYVEEHELGEAYVSEPGFQLQLGPEQTVRSPDVAFVREERIPSPEEESGFWALAPDLAVEIISPSETAQMIQDKVDDYLAAGVRLIWLVYPKSKRVVEYKHVLRDEVSPTQIRHLGVKDNLEGGDVIPGFEYALSRLFR